MTRFARVLSIVAAAVLLSPGRTVQAADAARVQQAISRGGNYLRSVISKKHGGQKSIIALAAMKAGVPKTSPEIQEAIGAILAQYDPQNGWQPDVEHFYSTSVAAVLLADSDPEKYKPVLDSMANYFVTGQRADGGWDYPTPRGTEGDTSVTHYALLGMWACARAGSEIPGESWERAIRWHLTKQNSDGGFSYTPGYRTDGQGVSMPNMSVNAVGSIAIAWLNLAPDVLPSLDAQEPQAKKVVAKVETPKNNDALEAVPVDVPVEEGLKGGSIPDGTANAMRRAFGWFAARFSLENKTTTHNSYYYYSLERMTAMIGAKDIGGHDWFTECSDFLLARQENDGSWDFSSYDGVDLDTAFVVLSLVKSTAKLIKRTEPSARFGEGTLVGGRGLPDNLSGGAAKPKNRKMTPLDDLLASLAKADTLEVEDVQEQLIEQVQIGDREELVKQKDLLVKLIKNPQAEVRRTAAWAIGRANDLHLARYLVTALEDPNLDVNIEAHNALCWISRKPLGFDLALDPLDGLALDAGQDVRDAAVGAWRAKAVKLWGSWYLENMPYADRGDEFEAQLREKLAGLH
jgi:hypothetical protein